MYLKHKDYDEPQKEVKAIPNIKSAITSFVGKGKKSYEEIVKEIQKTKNLTNDEIISQIEEVQKTKNYTPKVIEMVME